jgi:preprotein translocase subunit SecF
MKNLKLALLLAATAIAVAACSTKSDTSTTSAAITSGTSVSVSSTPTPTQLQTDLTQAGAIVEDFLAQALGVAVDSSVASATQEYLATGTINAKTIASNDLYAEASVAQGYVGSTIPAAIIQATAGDPIVAQAVAGIAAQAPAISQAAVNAIYAEAAAISPSTPSPTPAVP